MDRQEAVQKLARAGRFSIAHAEDLYDSFFPKPVVPQFVADWYGIIKDSFNYDLIDTINGMPYGDDEEDFSEIEKWLDDNNDSLTTLGNMHQFGYEVEKETRYTVRVKGIDGFTTHLNQNLDNQVWFFASNERIDGFRVRHTRKELEDADFGWVFFCEGVEVKEVDDGND